MEGRFSRGMSSSTLMALSYASAAFSSAAIHNIFLTYYINLFLTVFHLTDSWFYFGEIIFLLWNSLNDVLAGWYMDCGVNKQRHVTALKYGGLCWAFGYLIVFFAWTDNPISHPIIVGLHFIISLIIYDGLLSYVVLAHSSLLADISLSAPERAKCNMYNSIFGSIGSNSVFFAQLFWDKQDLSSFHIYLVMISIVSCVGFQITGRYLAPSVKRAQGIDLIQEEPRQRKETLNSKRREAQSTIQNLKTFLQELSTHRNFWIWVVINFIQVFNCHFNSNFFGVFSDFFLTPNQVPGWVLSLILSLASVCPHLIVIFLADHVKTKGLHFIMDCLFFLKLILGVLALLFAKNNYILIALYLLLNKTFSEAICRHSGLVVSDLVDEDFVKNRRESTKSGLLFGVNAFFTKPGQSVAPMLGWFIFSTYGTQSSSDHGITGQIPASESSKMFYLLVFVPIGCAIAQIALWRMFSLKGKTLRDIQQIRKESQSQC